MALEFKDSNGKNPKGIFIVVNSLSSIIVTHEKSYDFNNLEQILGKMKELKYGRK